MSSENSKPAALGTSAPAKNGLTAPANRHHRAQPRDEPKPPDGDGGGSAGGEEKPATGIFIVKPRKEGLKSVETFLRNRNWNLHTAFDLREAFAEIVDAKPDYVLICSDHQNAKIKALPRLIEQSLKTKIIVYAEHNAKTINLFASQIGCSYILYPPVSGPAVERMILRIQRDERKALEAQEAEAREASRAEHGGAAGTGDHGGGGGGEHSISVQGGSHKNDMVRIQGAERAEGKGYAGDNASGGHSGSMAYAGQLRAGDAGLNENNGSDGRESGIAYRPSGLDKRGGPAGPFGPGDPLGPGRPFEPGEPVGPGGPAGESEAATAATGEGNGAAKKPSTEGGFEGPWQDTGPFRGQRRQAATHGASAGMAGAPLPPSARPASALATAGQPATAPLASEGTAVVAKRSANEPIASVFVRGSEHAMRNSIQYITGGAPAPNRPSAGRAAEISSRVGCMEVNTAHFQGYLLAAWPFDSAVDDELMRKLREKLIEFMQEAGEQIEVKDLMMLKVRDVTFEGWAMRQAEFLQKAVNFGHGIAIAFFPDLVDEARLEDAADRDMAKLSLYEIKGDERVEFGVYIRLEANQKYILYTRTGGRLYEEQKQRLQERGHSTVFLRKDAAIDLRRYRIQNYLNEKIRESSEEEARKKA